MDGTYLHSSRDNPSRMKACRNLVDTGGVFRQRAGYERWRNVHPSSTLARGAKNLSRWNRLCSPSEVMTRSVMPAKLHAVGSAGRGEGRESDRRSTKKPWTNDVSNTDIASGFRSYHARYMPSARQTTHRGIRTEASAFSEFGRDAGSHPSIRLRRQHSLRIRKNTRSSARQNDRAAHH